MNDNLNETSIQNALDFLAQQTSAEGMYHQIVSTENRAKHRFEKYTKHIYAFRKQDSQTHLNVKTKFGYNTQIIKNSNIAKPFLYHRLQKKR